MSSLYGHTTAPTIRYKFALQLAGIALATVIFPSSILIRFTSFMIGFVFFFGSGIGKRYPQFAVAFDAQRTLFGGMPTDAQFFLQRLRAEPALLDALLLEIERSKDQRKTPMSATTASEPLTPSDAVKPKVSKSASFAKFINKALDVSEKGSEMLTGQKALNFAELRVRFLSL